MAIITSRYNCLCVCTNLPVKHVVIGFFRFLLICHGSLDIHNIILPSSIVVVSASCTKNSNCTLHFHNLQILKVSCRINIFLIRNIFMLNQECLQFWITACFKSLFWLWVIAWNFTLKENQKNSKFKIILTCACTGTRVSVRMIVLAIRIGAFLAHIYYQ